MTRTMNHKHKWSPSIHYYYYYYYYYLDLDSILICTSTSSLQWRNPHWKDGSWHWHVRTILCFHYSYVVVHHWRWFAAAHRIDAVVGAWSWFEAAVHSSWRTQFQLRTIYNSSSREKFIHIWRLLRGAGRAEGKQWQHNIVHNESTPAYGCAFAWLSSYFVPVILYLFHHPSIIMSSNFLNFAHQFLDYILSLALLLLRRRLLGCGCGCWFCVSRDQRNNTRNSLLLHPRALRSILCQIRLSAPLCCHHGSILPYYRPHTTPWSAYCSFLWAESGYGTTGAGCGID